MNTISVNIIAKLAKGKIVGDTNRTISRLLTDSRSLYMPEFTLFVAIKGINHDGHNYINELYYKGVRSFLVEKIPIKLNVCKNCCFIVVDNCLSALHDIATQHRANFDYPVTAITGSNGKTVVKEWLAELLNNYKFLVKSPKSYNSQIGVPLSVWQMDKMHELALFEAGISMPNEMNKLNRIIKPNIGIFTNIGPAHQENFDDTRQKIKEKLLLFKDCKKLIYCKDYKNIHNQIVKTDYLNNCELFTWSFYPNQHASLVINSIKIIDNYSLIAYEYDDKKYSFKIPFTDKASHENIINCLCWWIINDYELNHFFLNATTLSPIEMRLEFKDGINNSIIINDTFNSDLYSLSIAIDSLNNKAGNKKKTVILSDILQSGYNIDILYSEVADLINSSGIDYFIGIGGQISGFADKFNMKSWFFSETKQLINNLLTLPLANTAILIKGARKFSFEQISNCLQLKMHETVFEINLNALSHNLSFYRTLLPENTKLMVMVKAFSYGSGLLEIANLLQFNRVDYLAVAFTDEGVELRRNGISLPIMVMNAEVDSFDQLIEHNLEPEIYSFRILNAFCKALAKQSKFNYPVHIKIDTGMKRLGFEMTEINDLINIIKVNKHIKIASVFSHLAASDNKYEDSFTVNQIKCFEEVSRIIANSIEYDFLKHILNTSGIERFPNASFNMVRLGIGLYGISNNHINKLQSVGRLKTIISQIKTVKATDTVGYNRSGKLNSDVVLATLPIGYADGISRLLSNGVGQFKINAKKCPVVGNVCMDMCMIDISGVEAIEGSEVIVFDSADDIINIAEACKTIPYEVLTNISQRVKRVYIQE